MPNSGPGDAHEGLPDDLLASAADRLVAASPLARTRLLDELLREHPAHASQLRRLAADLAGVNRLLAAGFGGEAVEHATLPPSTIGGYRVQRTLGEGAFGIVYLCTQAEPVRREVAVKVLRPGAGDASTLARFEAERQFLARQSHPAITQVFDAGILSDGRPWFVMEHVRGLPVTQYCDQQRLSIEDRVALFQRLCLGVQHAHAHGIVHRDLKPANILVVEIDGEPQPKVIDFGIARALAQPRATTPIVTETGRVVGTPGYMSPEQAAGRRDEIDARSDVFSLGVILYELLSGELPWGPRPESTDTDPPRPSARVATATARATTVAEQRASQPRQLVSSLRGDLDWIVLKALARERERRYPSAQELAADLGRHLRSEPVRAGPPSLRYRFRKGVRRHRVAIAAASGIVLVTVLGAWSVWHFSDEASARGQDAAAAVARLVERANDSALRAAPNSAPLRRALLQDAIDFQDRFLRDRPTDLLQRAERAHTLSLLAVVHTILGECPRAIATAREAVADSEAVASAEPRDLRYREMLARAHGILGGALNNVGQVEPARQEMRQSIALLEECQAELPQSAAGLAGALFDLSATMDNETEAGTVADLLTRAQRIQQDIVAQQADSDETRSALMKTALALLDLRLTHGDLEAAEAMLQQAEHVLAGLRKPDSLPAIQLHLAAARLASIRGDHTAAIDRLQLGIVAGRRLCDLDPSQKRPLIELATLHSTLAGEQHQIGEFEARDASLRAAIETVSIHVSRFPDWHSERGTLAKWLSNYAYALLAYGRRGVLAEAEANARRAIEVLASMPAAFDGKERELVHWVALCRLGRVLDADGRSDAGLWDDASKAMLAWCDRYGIVADGAVEFAEAIVWIARNHLGAGRDDLAVLALDRMESVLAEQLRSSRDLKVHTAEAFRLRAVVAARRGDHAAAAQAAERALATDAGWHSVLAAADALRGALSAARAAGEPAATIAAYLDRSIELYQSAVTALEQLATDSPDDLMVVVPFGLARLRLAGLLIDRGEPAPAAALLTPALAALGAARNEALASEWDEALFAEGRRLSAQ